ncbi:hypothetical protein BC829DRAFT_492473 [Chytridium lagenaria]|nr:hypothetical protein BC829DRAFT_492473 [Chytridium lagenaria]
METTATTPLPPSRLPKKDTRDIQRVIDRRVGRNTMMKNKFGNSMSKFIHHRKRSTTGYNSRLHRAAEDAATDTSSEGSSDALREMLERRLVDMTLISSVQSRVINDALRERCIMREIKFPSPLEIPPDLPLSFFSPLPPPPPPPAANAGLLFPALQPWGDSINSSVSTPGSSRQQVASFQGSWKDSNPMHLWDATCPTLLDGLLPLLVAEGYEDDLESDASDGRPVGFQTHASGDQSTKRNVSVPVYSGYVSESMKSSNQQTLWRKREKIHINWLLTMMKSMAGLGLRWSKFKADPRAKDLNRRFVFGVMLYVLQRIMRLSGKAWRTAMPLLIGFLDANPEAHLYLPEEALESLMAVLGESTPTCAEGHQTPSQGVSPRFVDPALESLKTIPPRKLESSRAEEEEEEFFSASSLKSPPVQGSAAKYLLSPTPPSPRAVGTPPPIKILPPPLTLPKRVDSDPIPSFSAATLSSLGDAGRPPVVAPLAPLPVSELRKRIKVVLGPCERIVNLDDTEALSSLRARHLGNPGDGGISSGQRPSFGATSASGNNLNPETVRQQLINEGPRSAAVDEHLHLGHMVESLMSLSAYLEKFLGGIQSNRPRGYKAKRAGLNSPISPFGKGFFSPISPISPRTSLLMSGSSRSRKTNSTSSPHPDASSDGRSDFGKSWFWACPPEDRRRILKTLFKNRVSRCWDYFLETFGVEVGEAMEMEEQGVAARSKLKSILQSHVGLDGKQSEDLISQWTASQPARVRHVDDILQSVTSATKTPIFLHPVMMTFSALSCPHAPSDKRQNSHFIFKNVTLLPTFQPSSSSETSGKRVRDDFDDGEMVIALLGTSSKVHPLWVPPFPLINTGVCGHTVAMPENTVMLRDIVDELGDEVEKKVMGALATSPVFSAASHGSQAGNEVGGVAVIRESLVLSDGAGGNAESPPVMTFEVDIDTSEWLKQ